MTILTPKADSVRAASGTWQQQMKWAIRDVETLVQHLRLPQGVALSGAESQREFPVFVPLPFLQRIQPGNLQDPLLQQVLPSSHEMVVQTGFSKDPLNEQDATLTPGLLQKYQGRVLLITTGACAVHCRYCFRRHFPYSAAPKSIQQWLPAIQQIASDHSVNEVILSGGDPLTVTDSVLGELIDRLAAIPHVVRLRLHTRLPVMIPQRITTGLLQALQTDRFQTFVVIHSNHPNEFDSSVDQAIGRLRECGITMLNQTVLLKGINDDVETLVALSERLLQSGSLPYYLHQLDPVTGTGHFEVSRDHGLALIESIRSKLPGYAVPRYVKELAGESGKTVWA